METDWFVLPSTLIVVLVAAVMIVATFKLASGFYYYSLVLFMSAAGGISQFAQRWVRSLTFLPLCFAPGAIYYLTQREIFGFPFLSIAVTAAVLGYLPLVYHRRHNADLSGSWLWTVFLFYAAVGFLPLAAFPLTYGSGNAVPEGYLLIPVSFLVGWFLRFPKRFDDWAGVLAVIILFLLTVVFSSLQLAELGTFSLTAFIVGIYLRMLFASSIRPELIRTSR